MDFGSEYHEIIERVEIDGEILEVESTIDDHKYIKCSLDKFHKYIKDEYEKQIWKEESTRAI